MSSFFRVLVGEYASKLRIPALFVSRFSCLRPKTVTLFGSFKRSWQVDIEEEDNKELYFKRGWSKFVEDSALEAAEFIVFKFDGNSTFKAKIYAKSYLRRKASTSSFFKVLVGDEYTTKLRIPLLFVARFSTLVPKRVTFIRASSNRSWNVDIVEEDDRRLYYKSGWSAFVEDNDLEIAQFLVFKFDGDSTFKVKIYGSSACVKELENQPCVNRYYCIQHYKQMATQDRQETPNAGYSVDDVDGRNSEINDGTMEESIDHVGDRHGNSNQEQNGAPMEEVGEQSVGQNSELNAETMEESKDHDDDHGNSNQEKTGAPQKEAEEQSDEPVIIQPDQSHVPIKKTGNRYEKPMHKASDGSSPNLESKKNPSFKIFLQQAYAEKGVMCFPTEFFQKHMKNKRQEVEIETVDGVWTVTLLPHMKRTRTFARFSKGWSEFAKTNRFKTGETLVFKMVRTGDRPKFIVDRQWH